MRPLILVRYRGPNENSVLVLRVTQLLSSLPPLPGGGRPCLLNYELAILTSGSWLPHPAERQRAGYQGRSPWLVSYEFRDCTQRGFTPPASSVAVWNSRAP